MPKVNMAHTEAKVKEMLAGRTEASSWSLNKSTGLPIDRCRLLMHRAKVRDTDHAD